MDLLQHGFTRVIELEFGRYGRLLLRWGLRGQPYCIAEPFKAREQITRLLSSLRFHPIAFGHRSVSFRPC